MLSEKVFRETILNRVRKIMTEIKKMITISEIVSYLYCPRKLYLSVVKGIRGPPNRLMMEGKLRHNILESFSNREENLVNQIIKNQELEELLLTYQVFLREIAREIFIKNNNLIESFSIDRTELFKKILQNFEEDMKIRVLSIKQGISKGFFGEELWKNLKPKYISEMKLESEILGLKGRIDRVEFNEDKIIPYELKSRDNKIFFSDEIQLTAYAMLLEENYKKIISEGMIECSGKKQKTEIKEENKIIVLDIAEKIRNIDKNVPEMPSNFGKCSKCDLREECLRV